MHLTKGLGKSISWTSLVPRLSVQLFFARSKISEKKLDREPGNEAKLDYCT